MTKSLSRFVHIAAMLTAVYPKAVWGQTHGPKLDESLQALVDHGCRGTHSVIVRTADGYRGGLVASFKAHGNTVHEEFTSINAVSADVSCDDVRQLASFDSVNSISTDAAIAAQSVSKAEGQAAAGLQAPLLQTLAGSISSSLFSSFGSDSSRVDIGVAVIDSGIQAGLDFGNRLSAFYDFTGGAVRAAAPSDAYGHGTHVAGLIASQYVGIAPSVRLIGLKVLNNRGQGATSDVLRAIEFAVANKNALKIHVLNISLGHPIFEPAATDPLVQAVEHAVRAGLVVVVSAGNFGTNPSSGRPGYAGIASPGNAPSAITVGATRTFNTVTRRDDRVAAYSSRGPSWYDGFAKPDVVAPGDNLLSIAADGSSLRQLMESRGNTGNYMRLSGTSMAAGVASGVVALVLQSNSSLTPNALKAVLEYSSVAVSDEVGAVANPLVGGAGAINSTGAVALARSISARAALGQKWLSGFLIPYSYINYEVIPWQQRIMWGNHIARGTGIIDEQRPAWALNVVWGEALEGDDNIVWGNLFGGDDNVVWGNNFDLGDNIVWGNNVVWGNSFDDGDNVVWGNLFGGDDNIVWGNNIIWGNGLLGMSFDDDNVVWGNFADDNVVWGNFNDDNVVWGNLFDDNVVWGNSFDDDNVVWGNSSVLGSVVAWTGGVVKANHDHPRRSVSKAKVS